MYDHHANLGFQKGVQLQHQFPQLQGKGKTHRHLPIDTKLDKKMIQQLIHAAIKLHSI